MLIVKLIGGIGNQMFQYAFGKCLASMLQVPVKFDIVDLLDRSDKLNITYRDFELSVFKAKVEIASQEDLQIFNHNPKNIFSKLSNKIKRSFLKVDKFNEKAYFVYDPTVLNCSSYTYFEGFWQNEKYFNKCESEIRKDLAFKPLLSKENLTFADTIKSSNSISIHVRRGDYITNSQANQFHGVCSVEYYCKAVALIVEKIPNPSLFFFSDEPDWVKQNLQFNLPTTYISHNVGKSSFIDMQLMSMCKHNVIANSPFSWWGAWLNNNPKKIVIAPKDWMIVNFVDSSDLIPKQWIRI